MVTGVKVNHLYEIDEAAAGEVLEAGVPVRRPHFSDVSDLLRHTHHEEAFDDFALQPTLSKRMSQLGPGVSWFDVDADGWDDLIIGSGRGGHLAIFTTMAVVDSRGWKVCRSPKPSRATRRPCWAGGSPAEERCCWRVPRITRMG